MIQVVCLLRMAYLAFLCEARRFWVPILSCTGVQRLCLVHVLHVQSVATRGCFADELANVERVLIAHDEQLAGNGAFADSGVHGNHHVTGDRAVLRNQRWYAARGKVCF